MADQNNKNTKKKKRTKDIPCKPNFLLYWLAVHLYPLYLKLFRGLHADRSAIKGLKGPYVVVANHQSMVDFASVAYCCWPQRINFVVSNHYFHDPFLSKALPVMGCISRRQFVPGISSLRQMMRVIKRGGCVGIFPEGQTCFSGRNADIDPAIGGLVRALKVPVVNVRIRGNYLSMPKWACGKTFKGRTEAKAEILLTKEQVLSMTEGQIASAIIDAVSYDEYEWQRTAMTANPNRTPKGLDLYLYRCPVCGSEFTVSSDDKALRCSACGMTATMDEYGFLHSDNPLVPDTPSAWVDWEQKMLSEELDEGKLLPVETGTRFLESALGEYDEYGYRCSGYGKAVLDEDGITYTGTRDGEPFEYRVSPKVQWNMTHGAELGSIDIALTGSTEDRDFALDTDDPHMMIKLVLAWPLIRKKYHE